MGGGGQKIQSKRDFRISTAPPPINNDRSLTSLEGAWMSTSIQHFFLRVYLFKAVTSRWTIHTKYIWMMVYEQPGELKARKGKKSGPLSVFFLFLQHAQKETWTA